MKARYLLLAAATWTLAWLHPPSYAAAPAKAVIAAGYGHTLALPKDSRLLSGGLDNRGQLGLGFADTYGHNLPVQVGTYSWVAVTSGAYHSLGLTANGNLYAWGYNNKGQLGLGNTTEQYYDPTLVGPTWVAAAAGGLHTLGLTVEGNLWAWGSNASGQLGLGNTNDYYAPTVVPGGSGWVAVAAGDSHSLGLKADGTLYAWGNNGSGQLGLGAGDTTNRSAPTYVGSDYIAVAAGANHSLGIKSDGSLLAWGMNTDGQLGLGTSLVDNNPHPVPTLVGLGWVAVAGGYSHSLGLRWDGNLCAWGWNGLGQLGLGTTSAQSAPAVVGPGWTAVAAGYYHSLGLKADGSLWSWGWNAFGQLGLGDSGTRLGPVQVRRFNAPRAAVIPLN